MNTGLELQEQIHQLLLEGENGAIAREQTEFDSLAGRFAKSLVLFGCGTIGRKTAAGLQSLGIEPLAFADNNPALWGKQISGVTVVSPQEAYRRFGDAAAFVVTIWRGE